MGRIAISLMVSAALTFSVGASAQTAPAAGPAMATADNAILLTVFLKHDQSRPLSELNAQLAKQACAAYGKLADSVCTQQYAALKQTATALGGSCE